MSYFHELILESYRNDGVSLLLAHQRLRPTVQLSVFDIYLRSVT